MNKTKMIILVGVVGILTAFSYRSEAATLIGGVTSGGLGDGFVFDLPGDGSGGLDANGIYRTVSAFDSVGAGFGDTRVGDSLDNNASFTSIFKMELPTISAGEAFSSASFRYGVFNKVGTVFDSINIVYFEPTSDQVVFGDILDNTNAVTFTNQMDDSSTPFVQNTLSGATLDAAISNAYANGRTFVAFRIEMDTTLSDSDLADDAWFLGTSENADSFFHPQLTIETTTVPEPSTYALIGLGGVALFGLRRMRKN